MDSKVKTVSATMGVELTFDNGVPILRISTSSWSPRQSSQVIDEIKKFFEGQGYLINKPSDNSQQSVSNVSVDLIIERPRLIRYYIKTGVRSGTYLGEPITSHEASIEEHSVAKA